MAKISFWDTLIDDDISWVEASAINDATDKAEQARSDVEDANFRLDKLAQLCARQRTELGQLRTALDTLLTMLAESGAVDREIFGYRLEAAIENARERAQQVADATTCSGCGEQVARASTTITGDGTFCPRCVAGRA
ncbi:MAG TPA: hypothetical protein VHE35_24755 [Kofleriaceae bacterium]|nr:hypothetical protein [Kofleriaceae bacterium]